MSLLGMPRPGQVRDIKLLIGVNTLERAAARVCIMLDRNHTQGRARAHQWAVGLGLSGMGRESYTHRRNSVSAGGHEARPVKYSG